MHVPVDDHARGLDVDDPLKKITVEVARSVVELEIPAHRYVEHVVEPVRCVMTE
jgi:hypothetical protein